MVLPYFLKDVLQSVFPQNLPALLLLLTMHFYTSLLSHFMSKYGPCMSYHREVFTLKASLCGFIVC